MKSTRHFFFILFICSLYNLYSQTTYNSGIAVQGIARTTDQGVIASQNIAMSFTLYHKDSNNNETLVKQETKTITTDAYGVFSHTINVSDIESSIFSSNKVFLRINQDDAVISDEEFKYVPYAISANNGVPTGSIMPFIGSTAPVGWLLCDGAAIPVDANTAALRAMLGSNTPNLQAMFLRGTGSQTLQDPYTGPALKEYQRDEFQEHNHQTNTVAVDNHEHWQDERVRRTVALRKEAEAVGGGFVSPGNGYFNGGGTTQGTDSTGDEEIHLMGAYQLEHAGGHSHQIQMDGIPHETRPVNYGVNYIIKL